MWAYHQRSWLIPAIITTLILLCGYAAGTGNINNWNQ